jgi:hypothetical protein
VGVVLSTLLEKSISRISVWSSHAGFDRTFPILYVTSQFIRLINVTIENQRRFSLVACDKLIVGLVANIPA